MATLMSQHGVAIDRAWNCTFSELCMIVDLKRGIRGSKRKLSPDKIKDFEEHLRSIGVEV